MFGGIREYQTEDTVKNQNILFLPVSAGKPVGTACKTLNISYYKFAWFYFRIFSALVQDKNSVFRVFSKFM